MEADGPSRRARTLLVLGAIAGLGCAVFGLVVSEGDGSEVSPRAAAVVNGEWVRIEDFERAVAALAADRRDPIGDAERQHALDRLIDEELLIQRALELGLVRHDRRARADLVSALIQAVVSEAVAAAPERGEIETFYRENLDYFTQPGRVRLENVLIRASPYPGKDEALERAQEASRRLRAGEPLASVEGDLGSTPTVPLPGGLLPAKKLRDYLGPTAARAALGLQPGDVSEPVRTGAGLLVLRLLEREPDRTPALAEIEAEVRSELRRRRGDEAIRSYLIELRDRAEIRIASTLP